MYRPFYNEVERTTSESLPRIILLRLFGLFAASDTRYPSFRISHSWPQTPREGTMRWPPFQSTTWLVPTAPGPLT